MSGLEGTVASKEADRLADLFDTTRQHVYRMTEDIRPTRRKKRADAGKRKFDLVPGTDTFTAASLVIGGKLDPDQALLTARANNITNVPTLGTFQKLLREKGLGRKQRSTGRRGYRRWEAEHPLQIIQIDCTALKIRWVDEKTRRILRIEGIDKNHPQEDATKQRVWQIMAIDDHSRRRFMRYVTAPRITSRDMVEFCSELYAMWGMPWEVYTDNGSEFKGYFARAEKILSSIDSIASSGGYRLTKHKAGNSQASGKVEVAHKWAEKMDRYIGLVQSRGLEVTDADLNPFADSICEEYNTVRTHRVTGQTPMSRWFATRVTLRTVPVDTIKAALLSDDFTAVLDASMTISWNKVSYWIPSTCVNGKRAPFVDFIGQKVKVVVPHSIDLIFVTLPNGEEYEVDKVIATADKAGEFKTVGESTREQLTKELKKKFSDDNKSAKAQQRLTGEIFRIPHFNHEVSVPASTVRHFPHPEMPVTAEDVNKAAPIPMHVYAGKPVSYWQAILDYEHMFTGGREEAKQWLEDTLFPDKKGELPASDVVAAIESRSPVRTAGLRAVS